MTTPAPNESPAPMRIRFPTPATTAMFLLCTAATAAAWIMPMPWSLTVSGPLLRVAWSAGNSGRTSWRRHRPRHAARPGRTTS